MLNVSIEISVESPAWRPKECRVRWPQIHYAPANEQDADDDQGGHPEPGENFQKEAVHRYAIAKAEHSGLGIHQRFFLPVPFTRQQDYKPILKRVAACPSSRSPKSLFHRPCIEISGAANAANPLGSVDLRAELAS